MCVADLFIRASRNDFLCGMFIFLIDYSICPTTHVAMTPLSYGTIEMLFHTHFVIDGECER